MIIFSCRLYIINVDSKTININKVGMDRGIGGDRRITKIISI